MSPAYSTEMAAIAPFDGTLWRNLRERPIVPPTTAAIRMSALAIMRNRLVIYLLNYVNRLFERHATGNINTGAFFFRKSVLRGYLVQFWLGTSLIHAEALGRRHALQCS